MNKEINEQLTSLQLRCTEVKRAIEDCEQYLVVAADFTSSEEKQRTVEDIRHYQGELDAISRAIGVLEHRVG